VNSYRSATTHESKDVATPPTVSPPRNYLHFGPFHLNLQRRELFKDGARVKVQSKVIDALLILVEHPGQVITRETLRERLWPGDTQINYDANVNTTVNKLRYALGDSHDRPSYVETIPRRGYTFIAEAEFVEQAPIIFSERASAAGLSGGTVHPGIKDFLGALKASRWFAAGAISIFVGAVLFGAAVVLFAHRGY
jgi:DNA-binding winged helix-turn-helix (wHTH) protein